MTARVFNSQAVALADLNGDGKLDLIMANEGQDSAILFGNKELPGNATPLVVHVPAEALGGSTLVRVIGKDMQLLRRIRAATAAGNQTSLRDSCCRRGRIRLRFEMAQVRLRPKT